MAEHTPYQKRALEIAERISDRFLNAIAAEIRRAEARGIFQARKWITDPSFHRNAGIEQRDAEREADEPERS